MSEWTFHPSDDAEDHFFIEGPFRGEDLYAHFGDYFPGNSRAVLYPYQGTPAEMDWKDLREIQLREKDRLRLPGNPTSIGPLEHVLSRLLAADGCPWDREQTPLSLLRYLLDESYEAGEALVAGDEAGLADELGDVLLQIVFQSAIAESFSLATVVNHQIAKLMRRHPHVFFEKVTTTKADIAKQWEQLKALDPPRTYLAEWVYPSLVWARRLGKRGIVPSTNIFTAVSELLEVYIGNDGGKLEETLADAAWAVADVSRQHHQDAEWSLWTRLAFFSQADNNFS